MVNNRRTYHSNKSKYFCILIFFQNGIKYAIINATLNCFDIGFNSSISPTPTLPSTVTNSSNIYNVIRISEHAFENSSHIRPSQ